MSISSRLEHWPSDTSAAGDILAHIQPLITSLNALGTTDSRVVALNTVTYMKLIGVLLYMYFREGFSLVSLAKPLWPRDRVLFLLDLCQTCMQCKYNRDVPLDFCFCFETLNDAFGYDTVVVVRAAKAELLFTGFEVLAVLIQLVDLW